MRSRLFELFRNTFSTVPFLIIFTGFLLRLYPFIVKSFWQDELYGYYYGNRVSSIIQQIVSPLDDRPPIFYLLVKVLISINSSEYFLRFPMLIASILSIVILYFAMRKLHKSIAICVVFFSSYSLFLIDLSWQFRDYAIVLLITSALIRELVIFHKRLQQGAIILLSSIIPISILCFIGCMVNYLFGAFMISLLICQVIYLLIFNDRNRIKIILLICAGYLPSFVALGYYAFIRFQYIQAATEWIPFPLPISYYSLLTGIVGITGYFGVYANRDMYLELTHLYYVIGLVLLFVLLSYRMYIRRSFSLLLVACLCIFAFLLNVVCIQLLSSILKTSLFMMKTFVPSAVLIIISYSILFSDFLKSIRNKILRIFIISVLAVSYLVMFFNNYSNLYGIFQDGNATNDQFSEVLQYMNRVYAQYDQIVMFPIHHQQLYFPYYWRYSQNSSFGVLENAVSNNRMFRKEDLRSEIFSNMKNIYFVKQNSLFLHGNRANVDEYATVNRKFYQKYTSLCSSSIIRVFDNDEYTVESCKL